MTIPAPLSQIKSILRDPAFQGVSAVFILSVFIFYPTWKSLVDIWIRSETFAHGFIVIPISLWVIWQKKELHGQIIPGNPSWLGFAFTLLNGFLWLLGSLIHALVIQQYALIGILIGGIWYYLGDKTTKKLIFPLAFLYLMVPVGEALLPYLMQYTADFTIYLLRKTGLSVYREGMNFELVSGQWSVVEACSGLRYLLASFTLGTIYAYITYTKTYKRILFSLFSLILPIIANGFRAYMIVMIGHLSGMKLAVGVDHIIYGAIFFALIIFLMFYIGSFWKDPLVKINTPQNIPKQLTTDSAQYKKTVFILLLGLIIWPAGNYWLTTHFQAQTTLPGWPPLSHNKNWQMSNSPNWAWRPKFEKAVNDSLTYYQNQNHIIGFYQANFGDEKQGAELVNADNVLLRHNPSTHLNERKTWHPLMQFNTQSKTEPHHSYTLTVLRNNTQPIDFIALRWYQIGRFHTNNAYLAKLYQLYNRLTLDNTTETDNIIFFKIKQSLGINRQQVFKYIQQNTPLNLQ